MKTPKITDEEFIEAIKNSKSISDSLRYLKLPINGNYTNKIRFIRDKYNINTDHFDIQYKNRRYVLVHIECPVCGEKFQTQEGHPRQKRVCSVSCSNTFFRSGENHGNFNPDSYRNVCFKYWPRECAICGWNKVVDVHHIDYNHNNNEPKNLIPLCKNHHSLTTTAKYKKEIENDIKESYNRFWENYEELKNARQ